MLRYHTVFPTTIKFLCEINSQELNENYSKFTGKILPHHFIILILVQVISIYKHEILSYINTPANNKINNNLKN